MYPARELLCASFGLQDADLHLCDGLTCWLRLTGKIPFFLRWEDFHTPEPLARNQVLLWSQTNLEMDCCRYLCNKALPRFMACGVHSKERWPLPPVPRKSNCCVRLWTATRSSLRHKRYQVQMERSRKKTCEHSSVQDSPNCSALFRLTQPRSCFLLPVFLRHSPVFSVLKAHALSIYQ